MNFAADEQQQMIAEAVRAFADGVVRQAAAGWDREGRVPDSALAELGKLGVLGMAAPEELGGLGLDVAAQVVAIEELDRHLPAHAHRIFATVWQRGHEARLLLTLFT